MGTGAWRRERGDGSVETGTWGRERGDGRMGKDVWGRECRDERMEMEAWGREHWENIVMGLLRRDCGAIFSGSLLSFFLIK